MKNLGNGVFLFAKLAINCGDLDYSKLNRSTQLIHRITQQLQIKYNERRFKTRMWNSFS